MDLIPTALKDVYIVDQFVHADHRGLFVKTFREDLFREHGLETVFREGYYSESHRNVIRGMHFQLPPFDHAKIVTHFIGDVVDVVLDIRLDSPTYGQYVVVDMSRDNKKSVYIPKGCAHGFCAMSDRVIMHYMTSTQYSKEHDAGVHWNSFGFKWPVANPILSERDSSFPTLQDFHFPRKAESLRDVSVL